ncbi:hypothetical protein FNH22_07470 [Fulvivirga sp. M361]|uniref:hypothetical protein n=1 Tax=Fulvivirga sp. M361 TaxID=2594266 RepID=UPI00117B27C1|nr:hypothetical protein [Fulvivirga sp. M361]TRX60874.1 hypothetical protein FNH22_07470 [Fulvivirga sp. M361]
MSKVRMIMESPTERTKYQEFTTFQEKLNFIKNHFIMNDMAVRLLERKYLLSSDKRDELIRTVEDIIDKID